MNLSLTSMASARCGEKEANNITALQPLHPKENSNKALAPGVKCTSSSLVSIFHLLISFLFSVSYSSFHPVLILPVILMQEHPPSQ